MATQTYTSKCFESLAYKERELVYTGALTLLSKSSSGLLQHYTDLDECIKVASELANKCGLIKLEPIPEDSVNTQILAE